MPNRDGTEYCLKCIYFFNQNPMSPDGQHLNGIYLHHGFCRRNAPQRVLYVRRSGELDDQQPQVFSDDWCGEYEEFKGKEGYGPWELRPLGSLKGQGDFQTKDPSVK